MQSYKCDHCDIIMLHFAVNFKGSFRIYKGLNRDKNPDICCTQLFSLRKNYLWNVKVMAEERQGLLHIMLID